MSQIQLVHVTMLFTAIILYKEMTLESWAQDDTQ